MDDKTYYKGYGKIKTIDRKYLLFRTEPLEPYNSAITIIEERYSTFTNFKFDDIQVNDLIYCELYPIYVIYEEGIKDRITLIDGKDIIARKWKWYIQK